MTPQVSIVFAIFPDLTQLDFTGPHQVFTALPGAKVTTASVDGGSIVSDTGLIIGGVERLDEVERCDVLCVPGGIGTSAAMQDEAFVAHVRRLGRQARYITSVCTGSLLLGAAGLLMGRRAASHWGFRHLLTHFGATPVEDRVVRDGNVITGGGVTAGIDFALTVAAEIAGLQTAEMIQLMLEYAPAPPFDSGSPERASAEVLAAVNEMMGEAGIVRASAVEQAVRRMSELQAV